MSMVWGRRISPANVSRLVDDVLATIAEFGELDAEALEILGEPADDPEAKREFAARGLRRTARRLAAQSAFYGPRFAAADVDLTKLDADGLRAIPVTTKRDLIERPQDFRCADAPAYLATRTTGSTGRPAEVWLSRYEMELWPAMGALSSVLRGELRPDDVMQVSISSRATAATHLAAASCRLAGTGCRLLGMVAPDDSLDALADGAATILFTYPSYLAELVTAARRRGMGPDDFRLRRLTVGGEVLSPSLARAACRMFGIPRVEDSYSMTEVIPVTARTCGQGHLHHDVNTGLTELLDLETGEPAEPGALGTLVITPYFPYRDCAPVFRYDTRDVARQLASDKLDCSLAAVPATSLVLAKADHLLRLETGEIVTPRQLTEAIEALPTEPWPARYRAEADGGRVHLTLPEAAVAGYGEAAARLHFAEAGLDTSLTIVGDDEAAALRGTRSDLREATFVAPHALVGA
jgi:phenylacetate-coenzyme A ligase PaaK-like adenylate-forming protein